MKMLTDIRADGRLEATSIGCDSWSDNFWTTPSTSRLVAIYPAPPTTSKTISGHPAKSRN